MKLSDSGSKDLVRGRLFKDKGNLMKVHNLRLAPKVRLKGTLPDMKSMSVRVNVQRLSLKSYPVLKPLVVRLVREDFSGLVPSTNERKNRSESKSETASVTRRYGSTKTEDKENELDKAPKNQQHPRTQRKRTVHNYRRLSNCGFQTKDTLPTTKSGQSDISEVESSTNNGATQQIRPSRKRTVHNYASFSVTGFNTENLQATPESKHQNNLPNTIKGVKIPTLRNRSCLSPAVAEMGERELAGNDSSSERLPNNSIRKNFGGSGTFSCVSSTPVTKSVKLATSKNKIRNDRGKYIKRVQSGREKNLKVQTSLKEKMKKKNTEEQRNQLGTVDKEENVCQTNSHSQEEKPDDEIYKRPVRTRKINNYRCLTDSCASDSDAELQARCKKRIPVYCQIAPRNRALKKKDPFEFVPESPKSKRIRDSDSDCSFFDASMHKVLQKLRGKTDNKKKTAKPSHKRAAAKQTRTKKVVLQKALSKVGQQIPVGKPIVNLTRNVAEIGKQKATAKVAAIDEGGAKVGGVEAFGKSTTSQNETGAIRIVSNILITNGNTYNSPTLDIPLLPDRESHRSKSPEFSAAIDDCHSDISLPELCLDSVQGTGTRSKNGRPWRTVSLTGVSSLPIRKHNSLPSYCQDAVFKATEIEKMHTSRSSKNSNLASAKGTMQTAITDYVKTGSVLDTDLVLEESLFDANRFSPIRNNAAASTPNCNKTVKRKVFAPISCNEQDHTEAPEFPISPLSRESPDIEEVNATNACNLDNCFGFDSSEGASALPKGKEKAVVTYPARVSLRQVNRVFFVDEQQVVDVRALEKSYSPIPETGPEHPVALFDDPEEHFVLCEERSLDKETLGKGKKKCINGKKRKKKKNELTNAEQMKLNEWAAHCNSVFGEIDEFELETE